MSPLQPRRRGTRETAVFDALYRRLDEEARSLRGQVFDVLGAAFTETPLRDFLIDAVRGGTRAATRAAREVEQRMDEALTRRTLLAESADGHAARALAVERDTLHRAAAARLGPACVGPWFAAVAAVNGRAFPRGEGRWRVNHVPSPWRNRDPTLPERLPAITFDAAAPDGDDVRLTVAHPWTRALADALHADPLAAPAVLVDPFDAGVTAWWLAAISQTLDDATGARPPTPNAPPSRRSTRPRGSRPASTARCSLRGATRAARGTGATSTT